MSRGQGAGDGGLEVFQLERFGQGPGGAGVDGQAQDVVFFAVAAAGDGQDVGVGPQGLDPEDGFQAVHAGHVEVNDQEVGGLALEQVQGGDAVIGLIHGVADGGERLLDSRPNAFVVVRNQDPRHQPSTKDTVKTVRAEFGEGDARVTGRYGDRDLSGSLAPLPDAMVRATFVPVDWTPPDPFSNPAS